MRPARIDRAVFRRRLLPQYRLDGCRRWRRTLGETCWDFAVIQFMAKYNCDETSDEVQGSIDDFKTIAHRCTEECWGKSEEYRISVCSRYARLLERKLRSQ